MLTLTRRVGETINIGDDIQITVKEIRRNHVRLGLLAPKALKIYRGEVYQAIQAEQAPAPAAFQAEEGICGAVTGSIGFRVLHCPHTLPCASHPSTSMANPRRQRSRSWSRPLSTRA